MICSHYKQGFYKVSKIFDHNQIPEVKFKFSQSLVDLIGRGHDKSLISVLVILCLKITTKMRPHIVHIPRFGPSMERNFDSIQFLLILLSPPSIFLSLLSARSRVTTKYKCFV